MLFSHSLHNFTNVSNDDATLILVGRLFQTIMPSMFTVVSWLPVPLV